MWVGANTTRRIKKAVRDPRAAVRYARGSLDPRPEPGSKLAHDAGQYWNASRDTARIKDLSHWRDEGRWVAERWEALGERHYSLFQRLAPARDDRTPVRMLEWGPGGGSNVVAFARHLPIETFYGVDISAANLEECGRQSARSGVGGFEPIEIHPESPEAVTARIPAPLDIFLSTAVYQHFPSKAYGERVTRIASDLLRPAGVALIQTRYDDGSPKYRTKRRDYKSNAITFTSYDVAEFWTLLAATGLVPLAVHLVPDSNYAFYLAVK